jgi:hypothetical protein
MKLQHLTAFAFVLLGVTSLACSAPDDEIFMGSDDGGSAGSSAGTKEPGNGAGTGSGGKSQGGSAGGGSSNKAGSSSGGTGSGGVAAAGSPTGGTGPDTWDPCAGKACGEVCQACDPEDPDCFEAGVVLFCSATGECSSGRPACPVPECEGAQRYYAPGCEGPSPIAYPAFAAGCYDSCASAIVGSACAAGYTCTLVWHDPSVACEPGGSCIGACGTETMLCIEN